MSWIALAFVSALFLGCYDIAKKVSVRDNAVPMVLLVNVATAAALWLGPIAYASLAVSGGDPVSVWCALLERAQLASEGGLHWGHNCRRVFAQPNHAMSGVE